MVTEKAKNFIKTNAQNAAEGELNRPRATTPLHCKKKGDLFGRIYIVNSTNLSASVGEFLRASKTAGLFLKTRKYTFQPPHNKNELSLATCQRIQLGFHFKDKRVITLYTPTRPIIPIEEDGNYQLVIKMYFPSDA